MSLFYFQLTIERFGNKNFSVSTYCIHHLFIYFVCWHKSWPHANMTCCTILIQECLNDQTTVFSAEPKLFTHAGWIFSVRVPCWSRISGKWREHFLCNNRLMLFVAVYPPFTPVALNFLGGVNFLAQGFVCLLDQAVQ